MNMMQLVLVGASATAIAACGGATPAPTGPSSDTAATPEVATLKALQNGDRACYVVLETAAGESSREGSFELCAGGANDASALVGQPVTWTTETSNVVAAACEGDVDCGKSDSVELIVTLTAAP